MHSISSFRRLPFYISILFFSTIYPCSYSFCTGDLIDLLDASSGLQVNLNINTRVVLQTDIQSETQWEAIILTGLVPPGTMMVYVEIQGSYNGDPGDMAWMKVRRSQFPDTWRQLTVTGAGLSNDGADGCTYAWISVNTQNPELEWSVGGFDTPGATAGIQVALRGYIARGL